jgi:hypothetical protein
MAPSTLLKTRAFDEDKHTSLLCQGFSHCGLKFVEGYKHNTNDTKHEKLVCLLQLFSANEPTFLSCVSLPICVRFFKTKKLDFLSPLKLLLHLGQTFLLQAGYLSITLSKLLRLCNGTACFKKLNNYLNMNNYSYLETSGGQSSDLYLNVVHFFNASVN